MSSFGDVVRLLMDRRGLTGVALSSEIGISATSISKILQGHSKPKQVTFSRLIKSLCTSPEEEQLMVRSFTALSDDTASVPQNLPRPIPEDEVERVTRYLEVKSMSVAFKSEVESALIESGLSYQRDFRKDPLISDFKATIAGREVAIDCKYNVNRDWDRTYATVKLLAEQLPCDEVIIVIPYENELARRTSSGIESLGGRILTLDRFKSEILPHA